MLASTANPFGRNRLIVFAFVGDSTMTSAFSSILLKPISKPTIIAVSAQNSLVVQSGNYEIPSCVGKSTGGPQLSSDLLHQAFLVAKSARHRAYAPYSQFKVGAAVVPVGSNRIYAGCNVENASYGATICAERAAILAMIADLGRQELGLVVIVTDSTPVSVPCALCLQVIAEFADPRLRIHLASVDKIEKSHSLHDLLPHPFRL
jgi:homotetrameric cytidine deaminase